jgi:hypothetical protein
MKEDKHYWRRLMRSRPFKFKRNHEKGEFPWVAVRQVERNGVCVTFTSTGKTLADVKEFAAQVRYAERCGKLLSEIRPPDLENQI